VTLPLNRKAIFLLAVTILLVTACSQFVDSSPSTDNQKQIQATSSNQDSAIAAPTVDTEEIAAAVLLKVEANLAKNQGSQDFAEDQDAIVAKVVEQVETYLSEQKEPMPVSLPESALSVQDLQATLIDLYQGANPAVVFIIVPPIGSGSGFVFSDEGHIVTNNHVVEFGQEFEVVFSSGERRSAELVGRDVDSDLAVIQVDQLPVSVKPLPIRTSAELRVGQFVAAIGNPFGEQGSMSLGIISGLDRSLSSKRDTEDGRSYSLPEVIQTDAPINPGNSGGPLLNLDGEVVGVNSAIATTTGANTGVGFSIPSDAVLRIIPSLIVDGSYDYPYMGVSFDGEISLDDRATYGISQTQGAYVVTVTSGGPGDLAGLVPGSSTTGRGGDLIIDIDGVPINDFADLNSYLVFQTSAGQTIAVTVLRGGDEVTITLTLGSRPEN
jgi:2-alkenal reductase